MNEIAVRCIDINKVFSSIENNFSLFSIWKGFRSANVTKVLKNINFTIAPGEHVAVTGRNGSGKSTLLRLLQGIYLPTSGSIAMNGTCRALFRSWLPPRQEASVYDQLLLLAAFYQIDPSTIEEKITQILDWAELAEYRNRPFKNLSSGQVQRISLGVVLHAPGEILIIDEGPTFVDADFLLKFERTLKELSSNNTTLILSSHDDAFLKRICPRKITLEKGEIVYDGLCR